MNKKLAKKDHFIGWEVAEDLTYNQSAIKAEIRKRRKKELKIPINK